jgi:hypothetical protein
LRRTEQSLARRIVIEGLSIQLRVAVAAVNGPATRTMDIKPRHAGDDGGPDCRRPRRASAGRKRAFQRSITVRASSRAAFSAAAFCISSAALAVLRVKSCSGIWRPIALHGIVDLAECCKADTPLASFVWQHRAQVKNERLALGSVGRQETRDHRRHGRFCGSRRADEDG